MSENPSAEEVEQLALWQRRLAARANNRAWDLAEKAARAPDEDDEMLEAAHAALFLWKRVGDARQRAHAALLVAHVCALLKAPIGAKHYFEQSRRFLKERFSPDEGWLAPDDSPPRGGLAPDVAPWERAAPWEQALARSIAANVAAAAGDHDSHVHHHREAERLAAELADADERAILDSTLRVIPRPPA